MLESDWFLTVYICFLIWLVQQQTVRFDQSDCKHLVIQRVNSDSLTANEN